MIETAQCVPLAAELNTDFAMKLEHGMSIRVCIKGDLVRSKRIRL